jgi:predicted dehydrogenase
MTAASYQRVLGANDRVQIGVIGYGLIGAFHLETFKTLSDVDIVGMCDAHAPRVEAGIAAAGGKPKGYADFRKMLDEKNLHGVIVATPDQWHAPMTILACAAGKDVYVEKPMTLFIEEGRRMVNAAKKYNRVVQVGTQQRSGKHYMAALKLVQDGYLGNIHAIRMAATRNVMPGFGAPADGAVPDGLDYEMWLGPAPKRPFNLHRSIYHFRWFRDYSGGQMTNLGAHNLDIVHWFLNAKGPKAVASLGGRRILTEDNGDTPDVQEAIFDYGDFTVNFNIREACSGFREAFAFCGTKGAMRIGRGGFEIKPEMDIHPANLIPNWSTPPGHPERSDAKPVPYIEARKMEGSSKEQTDLHARNFVDCIKSREEPIAPIEDGHRVATACHIGNLAMDLGRMLRWDVDKEEFIGDREANKLRVRPYRKPWDDIVKSAGV